MADLHGLWSIGRKGMAGVALQARRRSSLLPWAVAVQSLERPHPHHSIS